MATREATEGFTAQEKKNFQGMLGAYDEKAYKKAVTLGDKLLENHPNHPETSAFKALALCGQGKRTESLALIKGVLFRNMKNFTCWHIFGIIMNREKDYDQARRAYVNALKYSEKNENVMKDLSNLQIMVRDYAGFEETRRKILLLKPDTLINWGCLAVACSANKNFGGAIHAINSMLEINAEKQLNVKTLQSALKPPQFSEVILLGARAYEGTGEHQKALDFLKKHEAKVVDKIELLDMKGRLSLAVGNNDASLAAYEDLLMRNSANMGTYYKVLAAKGFKITKNEASGEWTKLSADDQQKVFDILLDYHKKIPKSTAHLRVALRHVDGDKFLQILKMYVPPLLIKGVPSVMADLKEFYNDAAKVEIIGKLLHEYLDSIDANMTLSPEDEEEQDPTVQLWLMYFISHHYLYMRRIAKALEFVDRAIQHTPTLLELYTLKGKIFQRAGDRVKAAEYHEQARILDTADRAINAIAAMYFLKAEQIERGEETMNIFVKDCGYEAGIHDNQTMWFEQMTARAHYQKGEYRHCLKELQHVMTHLKHMEQDQYDYYLYSVRKFTLQAFEGFMKLIDVRLYQNSTVVKTAIYLLKLVHRIDNCREFERIKQQTENEAYQATEEYKIDQEKISKQQDEDDYKVDTDPEGFAGYVNLLDKKMKVTDFVYKVTQNNVGYPELHARAIPAFLAEDKLSAAVESATKLSEHFSAHPRTLSALAKLFTHWSSLSAEEKAKDQVTADLMAKLGAPESDVHSWYKAKIAALGDKAGHLSYALETCKTYMTVFADHKGPSVEALALESLTKTPTDSLNVYTAVKMHKTIMKAGGNVEPFATKAKEVFPHSTYFNA